MTQSTFTHGDLHRSNILITSPGEGPPRVTAIIDWHQSGWYSAYWEYCKARWTAEIGDEWGTTYLPKFLKPRLEVYDTWNYFVLLLGNVRCALRDVLWGNCANVNHLQRCRFGNCFPC